MVLPHFKIQNDPPSREGWLRKKGRRLKMWTRRWCKIGWDELGHTAILFCYHTEDTTTEKSTAISLERVEINALLTDDDLLAKGGPAYAIGIDTRVREGSKLQADEELRLHVFYAESNEEREAWIRDLQWVAVHSNIDNGYIIERDEQRAMLGSGSFSTVWKGIDRNTGKAWALKEINKDGLNAKGQEDIREEIEIQRRVGEHPNIVFMREFVETHSHLYIVLELLPGGALLDCIIDSQKGHFSERDALGIMSQLMQALEYIHSLKIVHRDLKPENFLLANRKSEGEDQPLRVCLADFGCACRIYEEDDLHELCGSPGYIAPEIIGTASGGGGYGLKSDIWSMGVILFILLTGTAPFAAANAEASFAKTLKGTYDYKPLQILTPTARDLLARMLVTKPSKRLSAKEVLAHPWMNGEGVGDTNLQLQDNLRLLKGKLMDGFSSVANKAVRYFSKATDSPKNRTAS
uniref:Protein kinase domain-containing protein n=1 Tax=Guillardia theta TaxID=55529 RepID=A0A7S4L041_GUITH|mmetsp:Transcript_34832/g.108990  ORF Transcript_34832/g.108990 Transcript_34832/m.108990 type:complete len:464 (+) Transcript_34832:107-1498(+)